MKPTNATSIATIDTLAANRGAGFATLWRVEHAYAVRDGSLTVTEFGEPPRFISPAGMPSLAAELARLRSASDDTIAVFASRWGLLGFGNLIHDALAPEPVTWIRAAAEGLHHVLALTHLLAERNDHGVRAYLDGLRVPTDRTTPPFSPTVTCTDGEVTRTVVILDRDDSTTTAESLIRELVNPNLSRISSNLLQVPNAGLQLGLTFPALVDIAYWHAARLVASQSGIARCRACGLYFIQTDPRQKFCPPSAAEHPNTESRCGRRFRANKERKGKNQQGAEISGKTSEK